MNKKLILFAFVGIFLLSFISANVESLGIYKLNEEVELKQTCANCTYINISSVLYPNSTKAISNVIMTSDGTDYNYTFTNTETVGKYIVNGYGDVDGIKTVFAYEFQVTLSGNKDPEGQSYLLAAIMLVTFGIAGVFLFLSGKMQEAGPKIFFLMASFIFLVGTLAITYVISFNSNLAAGINSSISALLYSTGLILIVIFAYIMIRQIKEAIELFSQNKGYDGGF